MSARKSLRLKEARVLSLMRQTGGEWDADEFERRANSLPRRKDVEARLEELRSLPKIGKRQFEEALHLVQALTLLDVWEMAYTQQTMTVILGVDAAMAEADRMRGKEG